MTTKVKGQYVIGFDGQEHVVYINGEVVYSGDTIIYVGHNYQGQVDEVINGGKAIISPGFIDLNALGDIDHALISEEVPPHLTKYLSWSEEYFCNSRREHMSVEEEAFKSLYAYSQLIMNGVTTAMPITSVLYKKSGETYDEAVAAAHHAGRLGLRLYLGQSFSSGSRVYKKDGSLAVEWFKEDGKQGLLQAVEFAKRFDSAHDGLIHTMLAPERIEYQTEETLMLTKKYAQELNCPIRLHAAQSLFEYDTIQSLHGKSSVAYLQELGFLGASTLIPHVIVASGYSKLEDKSDDDLDILSGTNTTVIHCPVVFSRMGIALESFGRYRRKGINMALGTDTFPCDIIENIRIGSIFAKYIDGIKQENSYSELFNAATLGGAKALNRDDLGRLCPGAKADIIIINLQGVHMGATDDPIRTMALCATGRDVVTSIVNGRVVMRDRVIPGLDLPDMLKQGQCYYEKMKQSYMVRNSFDVAEEELFKPSFRIVTAAKEAACNN